MKVGAHPLVVAVALGLLGPHALAEDDRSEGGREGASCTDDRLEGAGACSDCDCGRAAPVAADPLDVQAVASAWDALAR